MQGMHLRCGRPGELAPAGIGLHLAGLPPVPGAPPEQSYAAGAGGGSSMDTETKIAVLLAAGLFLVVPLPPVGGLLLVAGTGWAVVHVVQRIFP